MAKDRERFLELDCLRGLAALSVLAFHYTTFARERLGASFLPFELQGTWGVYLFFMISGYVIWLTLGRCETGWDFLVSRFSRLYPVYWACVLVTFGCAAAFAVPGMYVRTAPQMLVNLTMLQSWRKVPGDVDGAYWTLGVELVFYVWAWVIYALRRRGVLRRRDAMAVTAVVLIISACGVIFPRTRTFYPPRWVDQALLLKYSPFFLAGVLFQRIHDRRGTWREKAGIVACLATFALQVRRPDIPTLLVVCGLFGIMAAAVGGHLRWIVTAPLIWLGAISYPLYLLHQNIGFMAIWHLHEHGIAPWVAMTLAVAIVFALATGMTVVVERPALRGIRGIWKGFKGGRGAIRERVG